MKKNNRFTTQLIVQTKEIDELNHVNNIVYLQWIQDISKKHWLELTKSNPQNNFIWVVLRHEIDYLSPAILHDKITLTTWVEKTLGVKSIRNVEIYKQSKLLAKSQTTWCLVDKDLNPIRISEEIKNLLHSN